MIDRETLYRLYVIERQTTTEIARAFGVSNSSISNWLKKHGIPIRQGRAAQRPPEPTCEELYELYVLQGKSIEAIAKELGTSEWSISKLLDQCGIPKRDKADHLGGWNKGIPMTEEQRRTLSEIAKRRVGPKSPRYGVTLPEETRLKIANSLKGRFCKHLNPNWKNSGIAAYRAIMQGRSDYADWRKAVFQRDEYTCQMCDAPSKGNIQAHHIHPVSRRPELMLDATNGVTLCEPCHRSIKGREAEYIAVFEAITLRLPIL